MGKFYKEISKCNACKKKYVIDKKSDYFSRYYCPECYKKQAQSSRKSGRY